MRTTPPTEVFTVDDALAHGWTPSALKHAVAHGRLIRLRRGVYSTTRQPGPMERAIAVARVVPDAVVSHRSAARLLGIPVTGRGRDQPTVTVPARSSANHPGAHVHRAQLRPEDITLVDGVPVTSAARTVVDLGRHLPLRAAVIATDHALHRCLTDEERLADVLRFCAVWPGIRRAQRAVTLADGRSESPLESLSRLTIADLGLPRPELQRRIIDQRGVTVARCDFSWDAEGVVGEADGHLKYVHESVLAAEKERQEVLEDLGLIVVRWGWAHVARNPETLRHRLDNGFERARRRDRSGFPRLWTL